MVLTDYKVADSVEQFGLLRAIRKDIRLGYTPIIAFVGRPRTGKSMSALALCRQFDKKFTIEENCFFDMGSFLKAHKKMRNRWFLIDEADEKMNRTEHYSKENQVMNSVLRTQAINRNVLVFCLPAIRSLASTQIPFIRFLVNMKRRQVAQTKALDYKFDSFDYNPFKIVTLDMNMRFPDLPKWLVEKYKKKEMQDKKDIYSKREKEYYEHIEAQNPKPEKFVMPKMG